ncbi:MAG: site-2 protease family protein [Thiotrichales bacterium]|nr:site-2 protease family protein [Thiotrichales bacterium]MBT3854448.1 site-2 protease family protein [Thiotrichales bacterium]MBT5499754.1 site-2 protease family protein [Thiotrichales bacterium]MBT6771053.1 site-2 protease family protein [Thiotrichales bacterium]MBT7933635.1 site-2 protease family protein [Thiotrichales bacterium]
MPDFQSLLIYIIPLLFAITLHEAAHGWVASKLGDHTARMMGRVTLDPTKHIDPIGTIAIPLVLLISSSGFIFGWAKPVPINFNALRSGKSGMIWVALAGPGANLLMAIGWLFVMIIAINMNIPVLIEMGRVGILVNCVLAVFNLLPIPPLDGSRVISALLPNRLSYQYNQLEQYGLYILLGLMFLGGFNYLVRPSVELLLSWFQYVLVILG